MKAIDVDKGNSRSWGERALAHARALTSASPGRGSATQGEARAAEYVRRQLAALHVKNVHTQPFQGLRSIWLFLSQVFGMGLVGHAAFWLLAGPVGELGALLITVAAFTFGFYLLWQKFTFQDFPLRQYLPHGPSQNVIAVLPPQGVAQHRLVLMAHLDSHRAVWLYAHDVLVRVYAWLVPVAFYGLLAAPLLYFLAFLSGQRVFTWLALPLALVQFVGWFTGVTADLGPYSPGANDNASAVGSVLALAERLQQQPLQHTEVWLAFTGCEETGGDGVLNLLKEHGAELTDALFLDFELVGIGERLVYLQQEGLLRQRRIAPDVEQRVKEVGERLPIQPASTSHLGVFTENAILWEHGYQSLCLMVLPQGTDLLPEWHRLTDVPSRLQPAALDMAHDFAWELIRRGDVQYTDQLTTPGINRSRASSEAPGDKHA